MYLISWHVAARPRFKYMFTYAQVVARPSNKHHMVVGEAIPLPLLAVILGVFAAGSFRRSRRGAR